MVWLILAALIAFPVVEITLFIKSAQWMGVVPTILVALAAGAVGLALLRHQGFTLLMRTRSQFELGEMPVGETFDALCLALAGVLLVLPGFFSDILALFLLLPPVRLGLKLWLASRLVQRGNRPPRSGPQVIETEYHVIDKNK